MHTAITIHAERERLFMASTRVRDSGQPYVALSLDAGDGDLTIFLPAGSAEIAEQIATLWNKLNAPQQSDRIARQLDEQAAATVEVAA